MTLRGFENPRLVSEFEDFVAGLESRGGAVVDGTAIAELLRHMRAWMDAHGVPYEQRYPFLSVVLGPFESSQPDMTTAERERLCQEWADAFGMDVEHFKRVRH